MHQSVKNIESVWAVVDQGFNRCTQEAVAWGISEFEASLWSTEQVSGQPDLPQRCPVLKKVATTETGK